MVRVRLPKQAASTSDGNVFLVSCIVGRGNLELTRDRHDWWFSANEPKAMKTGSFISKTGRDWQAGNNRILLPPKTSHDSKAGLIRSERIGVEQENST
jgi:hypothetical protein